MASSNFGTVRQMTGGLGGLYAQHVSISDGVDDLRDPVLSTTQGSSSRRGHSKMRTRSTRLGEPNSAGAEQMEHPVLLTWSLGGESNS
jgi:hypothetical protein